MHGLTLAQAQTLKAKMIPPWIINAAQHQRDIAMNYYMKATDIADYAEKQTKHSRYLAGLADAEKELKKYRRHIQIADGLLR
jgi:hypothetical protein